MIISVSGRCDICAYFSEWLMNRLKAGFVDVRNPFYPQQVSRIFLDKEHVDAIIFCTKNIIPMMKYIEQLDQYPYMFQITLTPYKQDIEPNVVDKRLLINKIIELSKRIGSDRIMLRYDPILLNENYTIDYHIRMFNRLCNQLQGYVCGIIISFLDMKKNTEKYAETFGLRELSEKEIHTLAEAMGMIAAGYGMSIQTCAEAYDLRQYGFVNRACISNELIYQINGKVKQYPKKQKRDHCKCLQNVDIGQYNVCMHYCRYCYANYDEKQVMANGKDHDPTSTMLIGHLKEDDIVKVRQK